MRTPLGDIRGLSDGEGTYESLMEKKGLFAALVEGQRAEETEIRTP
ncbi:MAG: hypothetical protein IJU98_12340 [Synergistaceae bacterium]|nr:hypothetical protein [Synergistaceae bacterium]